MEGGGVVYFNLLKTFPVNQVNRSLKLTNKFNFGSNKGQNQAIRPKPKHIFAFRWWEGSEKSDKTHFQLKQTFVGPQIQSFH